MLSNAQIIMLVKLSEMTFYKRKLKYVLKIVKKIYVII